MSTSKVWLITGASKGLGYALAKKLLAEGHKVIATSRNKQALIDTLGEANAHFLPWQTDITDEASVAKTIEAALEQFTTIDVVVNNAGYGQVGTLEEATDEEVKENYNVNVFGTLHVIRKVMPFLRKQGFGHVINIASVGGLIGNFPGWGVYCSTKFAVAGLTEALAEEVKEFGVKATVVYPGYFRTNFLEGSSLVAPKHPIDAYTKAREIQQLHEESINGNQPGDPEKAAIALIALVRNPEPPVHLFLGSDAYGMVGAKINIIEKDLEENKDITLSTDF